MCYKELNFVRSFAHQQTFQGDVQKQYIFICKLILSRFKGVVNFHNLTSEIPLCRQALPVDLFFFPLPISV